MTPGAGVARDMGTSPDRTADDCPPAGTGRAYRDRRVGWSGTRSAIDRSTIERARTLGACADVRWCRSRWSLAGLALAGGIDRRRRHGHGRVPAEVAGAQGPGVHVVAVGDIANRGWCLRRDGRRSPGFSTPSGSCSPGTSPTRADDRRAPRAVQPVVG